MCMHIYISIYNNKVNFALSLECHITRKEGKMRTRAYSPIKRLFISFMGRVHERAQLKKMIPLSSCPCLP